MSLKGKVEIVGLTDTGLVRKHNEDAIRSDATLGVAVLADGMGGPKAGEVASAMAVEVLIDELGRSIPELEAGTSDDETGYALESLAIDDALGHANEAIYRLAQSRPKYAGMGTTVVVALFYDNRMTIAHVGDSRLYRLRAGTLEQVTSDHSLVQELVDQGFYTEEEARHSHNRNVVTRALGIAETVAPEIQEEVVAVGDVYLLCSDGLNDMVDDDEIQRILCHCDGHLGRIAERLITAANSHGGRDNVSVLLARANRRFPIKSHQNWFSRVVNWFD